jgi:hypothetical protein
MVPAGKRKVEVDDIAEPKAIDALPVLHAIIMETLRLWPEGVWENFGGPMKYVCI